MNWLWFFAGMMVGAFFGIITLALVSGNREFEERIEEDDRRERYGSEPRRDYNDW